MKEDNTSVVAGFGPDLLLTPHVLPILMELLAGDVQNAFKQREQLQAHLATCHYCRTALITLLALIQEHDHRNNKADDMTHDLLARFVNLSREIESYETREYERLGAYAEAIVVEGRDKAALRFPDVAAHMQICSDCRSAVEANVSDIIESEEPG